MNKVTFRANAKESSPEAGNQEIESLPVGRGPWRWPWAVVATPLVISWHFLAGRRLLAPGDGLGQYLPWYITSARSWLSGHLPTWNPYAFSGFPLLAQHQPAALYPPNLILTFLPPVFAFNFTIILTMILSGLGAWLLADHLTKNRFAATAAGLAFTFCGFVWGHVAHTSMIAAALWLPWMLFGYELLRERFTPLRLLLGSGAIALSTFAGHPQILLQNLLALAVYVGTVTLIESRTRWIRALWCGALMFAVGIALSLVQILPTARVFLDGTQRTQSTYEISMQFSFPTSHAVLLAFPYLFGHPSPAGPYTDGYEGQWNLTELSGYPGVAAIVLAAAGLGVIRRDKRAIGLLVMGGFTLALAFGPSTPLSKLVFRVPGYGQLRSWGRYIAVFDLTVAILAAYGVDVLMRSRNRLRTSALIRSFAAAALVLVTALVAPRLSQIRAFIPNGKPTLISLLIPTLAGLIAVALLFLLVRDVRFAQFGLAALLVLDGFLTFGAFYDWRSGSLDPKVLRDLMDPSTPFNWGAVKDAPGGVDRYAPVGHVWGAELTHLTDIKGVRSFNGNDPFAPLTYLETLQINAFGGFHTFEHLERPGNDLLDLLRITTVVALPDFDRPENTTFLGIPTRRGNGRFLIYEYQPKLPEAFVVGAAERRSRYEILSAIYGYEEFDPRSSVLIGSPCTSCPSDQPGVAGTVKRTSWGLNWVIVDVSAERAGMLVLSQAWSRGWQAWIDGKEVPVLRANEITQTVPIGEGNHRVEFRYRAPWLKLGFVTSATTLVGLVAWGVINRLKRRDEPEL